MSNTESSLDCKEIKLVNPKGNQSWISTGRTDAKAEAPILWSPDVNSWLIGRDPDAGKDWRQEERATENGWLDSITDSVDLNLRKLWEMVEDRGAWHSTVQGLQRVRHDLTTEQKVVLNWGWSCRAHPCAEDLWQDLETVWALVTGVGMMPRAPNRSQEAANHSTWKTAPQTHNHPLPSVSNTASILI